MSLALGDKETADRHSQAALKSQELVTFPDPLWDEVERAGATKVLLTRRGLRLLRAGALVPAVNKLQQAVSAGNTDPAVRYNLGTVLLRLGRNREALDVLEGAVKTSLSEEYKDGFPQEKRALIYAGMATVHRKLGNLKDAEESYKQALHLDPESKTNKSNLVTFYMMLGLADARQGKIQSAETFMRKALAQAPQSAKVLYNLAVFYQSPKRLDESIKLLHAAREIRPHRDILSLLTALLRQVGDHAAAQAIEEELGQQP